MFVTMYFTKKQADLMLLAGGEGWYSFNPDDFEKIEPPKDVSFEKGHTYSFYDLSPSRGKRKTIK